MPDYKPVVKVLIEQARQFGYTATAVQDAEGVIPVQDADDSVVISEATATDEAMIVFRNFNIEPGIWGHCIKFWLVYGNQLHETISDFTDHGVAEIIATAVEEHF